MFSWKNGIITAFMLGIGISCTGANSHYERLGALALDIHGSSNRYAPLIYAGAVAVLVCGGLYAYKKYQQLQKKYRGEDPQNKRVLQETARQAETTLRAAHDLAKRQAEAAHAAELQQKNEAHAKALTDAAAEAKRQAEAAHKVRLEEINREKKRELDEAIRTADERTYKEQQNLEAKLKAEHEAALQKQRDEHAQALADAARKAEEAKKAADDLQRNAEAAAAAHAAALQQERGGHAKALEGAAAEAKRQAEELAKHTQQDLEAKLNAGRESALQKQREEHAQALAEATEKIKKDLKEEMAKLRNEHDAALKSAFRDYAILLADATEKVKTAYNSAGEEAKARKELEKSRAALKAKHEKDLIELREDHAKTFAMAARRAEEAEARAKKALEELGRRPTHIAATAGGHTTGPGSVRTTAASSSSSTAPSSTTTEPHSDLSRIDDLAKRNATLSRDNTILRLGSAVNPFCSLIGKATSIVGCLCWLATAGKR
jgi:hypothetical protein